MHQPIPEQGKWLKQVVTGYFNYHAVPTNGRDTPLRSATRHRTSGDARCGGAARRIGMTWERITQLANDWLPNRESSIPGRKGCFAVTHPRWEPYARIGPVRFCAGGAQ